MHSLRRKPLLTIYTLAWCLVCAVLHAEVLELEGVVRAVDADARTITIVRKTPKGEKVLELEVAKNAGDLSSVDEGDDVSVTYDPSLELVSLISKRNTSTPTTDADLSPEEQKLVGDWQAGNGKEGKSFDATRVVREWDASGTEFNRGVWLVRKDGTFLGAFRNRYSIEGKLTDTDTIEFTVFDPQRKVIEKLRMNKVK